jgi:hypothetical protein
MTGYVAFFLAGALLGLFLVHAVVSRLGRHFGYGTVAPQTIALCTILASNVPVLYLAWNMVLQTLQLPDRLCGVLYVLLTYNALCFGYFCILNVTETSLHINILMRMLAEDGTRPEDVRRQYSVKDMINARIERMKTLSQIEERAGRYYLRNHAFLVIERLYDIWRRILGLPLSPASGEAAEAALALHRREK